MTWFVAVLMVVALVAAACGDGGGAAAPSATRTDESLTDRVNIGPVVYETSCAVCHGAMGEGGVGPSLVGLADQESEAETREVVENGTTEMPAFGGQLSENEIDAVVEFVRQF